MMPMSQRLVNRLMSVSGERSISTSFISSISRSSISRIAMWQPKHPASEAVAIRAFLNSATALPLDLVADQPLVELAFADRRHEAHAFADDAADRADLAEIA
jgi:hypothetical protein